LRIFDTRRLDCLDTLQLLDSWIVASNRNISTTRTLMGLKALVKIVYDEATNEKRGNYFEDTDLPSQSVIDQEEPFALHSVKKYELELPFSSL
jgi:hypothetical protein